MFLCSVQAGVDFTPVLNFEHRAHGWFSPEALRAAARARSAEGAASVAPAPLHPVVTALLSQYPGALAG